MTTTDQPALTNTTPADTTFRCLARLAKEHALSDEPAEGAPDIRPIWRFAGFHAQRLAVLCRKLPAEVRDQFTADHIVTMLRLCITETPMDTPQRKAWRTAYGVLLALLHDAGARPAPITVGAVSVGCALWCCLQQMANETAMGPVPPPMIVTPNHDPAREEMAQRQQCMQLREMLIADWCEATMNAAGHVLGAQRAEQTPVAEGEPVQVEASPAEEPAAS